MIKTIDELREQIKYLEKDEIEEFITFVQPFYDFYDYMAKNYNMSFEEIEEDSGKYSEEIFTEYLEQIEEQEEPLKFIVTISADIFKRYAENHNYSDADKIKESMIKYSELLVKYNIKQNGKQDGK